MKKIISIIAIFLILISSVGNTAFALTKYNPTPTLYGTNLSATTGITQATLTELLANGGFTGKGLTYLLQIKGVTTTELAGLKNASSKEKANILNKLVTGGLTGVQVNYLKDNGGLTSEGLAIIGSPTGLISTNFIQNKNAGEYKINFVDIIPGVNAGVIQHSFVGKESFPTKFILENGIDLKLDSLKLNEKFVRINDLKDKKLALQNQGIDFGTIDFKDVQLNILPDRIQLIETAEIKYTNDAQLENIKTHIYNNTSAKGKIEDIKKDKTITKSIQDIEKSGTRLEKSQLNKLNNVFVNDFNLDETPEEMEEETILGLIKECKVEFKDDLIQTAEKCNREEIERVINEGEKTLEFSEKIEFSLIPPVNILGNTNSLKQDPSTINLSRNDILQIFDIYGMMMYEEVVPEDDGLAHDAPVPATNLLRDPTYCDIYSNNQAKKDSCLDLQERYLNPEVAIYKKDLLNGFTLGEEHSYEWSTRLRVSCCWVSKTLAKLSISFYYSYGFGLRIPIQAEVEIDKDRLDDYEETNNNYTIKMRAKTIDGSPAYYRSTLGANSDKIFDGKEFVLELSAGIEIKVRVIGDFIDEKIDIPLVSILATLARDKMIQAGIPANEIDEVIANNKFDKGSHFIAPFAGTNTVELAKAEIVVPLYSWAVLELLGGVGFVANLDGEVTVECEMLNSDGGCSDIIEFKDDNTHIISGNVNSNDREYSWQEYDATAKYNKNEGRYDEFSGYNNYGAKLDNFKYYPVIDVSVYVKGGAAVYIPARGWETWRTPDVTIYSFEISDDDIYLGTHAGTNGLLDATKNNIIYTATSGLEPVDPVIVTTTNGSESEFNITGNEEGPVFNFYNINSIYYPNCGVDATGEVFSEGPKQIWETPYSELIYSKSFKIQARGCSVFGAKSNSIEKSVNLNNTAFDINVSSPVGKSINSDDTLILSNPYVDSGDIYLKYDFSPDFIDGWNDANACSKGISYDNGISLHDLAKTKLQNNFLMSLDAIACNSDDNTLRDKGLTDGRTSYLGITYTVHNNEFNPNIGLSSNRAIITSYEYPVNGYRTTYVTTLNGDDPTCSSGLLGVANQDDIMYVPGMTIKARTCIKTLNGNLVFSSDIISEHTDAPHEGRDDRFQNGANPLDRLDDSMMGDMFAGFDGQLTNPGFMGGLNILLDGGGLDMGAVQGMNMLMMSGDMGGTGMGALGAMIGKSANQITLGFKGMLSGGKISRSGLVSISTLLKGNKMTVNGLTALGALYSKFGISYIGAKAGNKALPGAGVQTYGMNGGPSPYFDYEGEDDDNGKNDVLRERQEDEAYFNCNMGCMSRGISEANRRAGAGIYGGNIESTYSCTCSEDYPEAHARAVERKRAEDGNNAPLLNLDYKYPSNFKLGDNFKPGFTLQKPATSDDEYVNEKLDEINDCFKSTYTSQLENIEKTITLFENNRDKLRDENDKSKYQKAIIKLEEIKKLFIERYKFVLDYEE
ncbi:MAG: hypothetical protein QM490_00955 [Candidatus Gracilibacteria bacterium]